MKSKKRDKSITEVRGKMFNKKKHPLLFYKYLVSYLIIFLIPFLTISIVFYQMSANTLRKEIIDSNIQKMEQVRDITDAREEEFVNIAARISSNYRLTPYKFTQPYKRKEAIEELIDYQVNNTMIDELYLYFMGQGLVYSSRGTSSINTFLTNAYPVKKNEFTKFKKKMRTFTKPTIYPINLKSKKNDIIAYLYPVPLVDSEPYGKVAFFVKEKEIKSQIENILGDFEGNVYVYNDQNELLTSSNKGEPIDSKYTKEAILSKENGVTEKRINDQDYSVVTVHSHSSNWSFVTVMPTEQFYGKMTNLKITIILILTVIALIGIGVTIFMAFRQYKPIKGLAHQLKQTTKQPTDDSNSIINQNNKESINELVQIQEAIALIQEDRRHLHHKMKKNQPYLRDQLLLLLLKGDLNIDLGQTLKDLQITFPGNHFFAAVVSLQNDGQYSKGFKNREGILNELREVSRSACVGYGVEMIHDNAVALIVNISDFTDPSVERKLLVDEIVRHTYNHGLEDSVIGVGNIYESIDYMNRSFIEAQAAIEYIILNANDNTFYFKDISTKDKSVWFPVDNKVKFVQSLKQGDRIVALETLDTIITDLKNKDISIYSLKTMCYDIINIVLKNTSEMEIMINDEMIKPLIEFYSLNDLEEKLTLFINQICDEVANRKGSHNDELRDNIMAYIEDNFKLHELSLELIADVFQISSSYLSRFIKEQTGFTFSQYVWELRSEECKRLLIETECSIKEIVLSIGYVDVANFTRKFKNSEGITPGQYRKKNRADKNEQEII